MFTEEELAEIERLLYEGLTAAQIARRIGLSQNTFQLRLARSGKTIVACRRLADTLPLALRKQQSGQAG